jgi:hypothetical protein
MRGQPLLSILALSDGSRTKTGLHQLDNLLKVAILFVELQQRLQLLGVNLGDGVGMSAT